MHMPPMVIDEVILLIDTYFKICATNDKNLHQLYREDLSAALHSLPFFPELRENPTFRNIAGMTLLLMNVDKVITKKWPNNKISKTGLKVLNRYQNDKLLLFNVAQAIKYISISGLDSTFHVEMTCDFIGGALLFGYHNQLETKNDQAIRIRKNLIDVCNYKCSICQDDLSFTYGSNAASLMELHFAAQIEWYTLKIPPAANQFLLLCPNCHRLAHSDVCLLSEDQLRCSVNL